MNIKLEQIYETKLLYYSGIIKKIDKSSSNYDSMIKKYLESIANYIYFKQLNKI